MLLRKINPSTPRANPSTPLRTSARGTPFDRLKAPSAAEGLSLPAGRQGLILSGASYPDLKIGASAVSSAERFGAVERIKRFSNEIISSQAHGFRSHVDLRISGHHDHHVRI
jgi:hypothetical protein